MLSNGLVIILLVAACSAQSNVDLDALIKQLYGTPPPSTPAPNKGPSTIVPLPTSSSSNVTEYQTCTTDDGKPGVCVPYLLCNLDNTLNTDGFNLIDIRFGKNCPSYLDVCCLAGNQRPPTDPVTPKPEPNESTRKGCGWRNPNGVGIRTTGELDGETKFGEFPWMCAIVKLEPINSDEPDSQRLIIYVGGGSLIHPSVVLTAAHYVAATQSVIRVRAGEWDTQSTKEPYPYQEKQVASKEVHRDFIKGNLFYDIALLFLAQPMELTPNVQVACLPPPRQVAVAGTRCFATGWGKDKFGKDGRYQVILKKIEVPVVDRATCQIQLRRTRLGRFYRLHSSFMCAGGEPGIDMCKGDGGSPLSCPIEEEPGRFAQTGIVAWGIGCGQSMIPGVYVDVANLRNWIDDKVVGKGYDSKTYDSVQSSY